MMYPAPVTCGLTTAGRPVLVTVTVLVIVSPRSTEPKLIIAIFTVSPPAKIGAPSGG
jgi:hypothetical protein